MFRSHVSYAFAATVIGSLFLAAGCSGGTPQPPPPPVVISVAPATASLQQGATQSFTAAVTNTTNSSVSWSVQEGAAGGSIDATGKYTAPNAAGTFHAVVTSVADPTKTAIATVTVADVTVAVSPAGGSFLQGQVQQFTATVTGHVNTNVTWSVQEGAAGGTIDATGKYTAPNVAGTFHVVATSQGNPGKSSAAAVTISDVTVTIAPGAVAIQQGGNVPFTASVTGSVNTAVNWSILPAGYSEGPVSASTIGTSGQYTAPTFAPGTPGPKATDQVVATAQGNAARSATATVRVFASTGDLTFGFEFPQLTRYQSSVVNLLTTGGLAIWSAFTCSILEGSAGGSVLPIDPSKLSCQYLANASPGIYHVVATPTIDPARAVSAAITVQPLTSFALDPSQEILGPGLQRTILAYGPAPIGQPDLMLSWTVNGGSIQTTLPYSEGVPLTYLYQGPTILGDYRLTASAYPTSTGTLNVTVASAGYFSPGPPWVWTGSLPFNCGASSAIPFANGQIMLVGSGNNQVGAQACGALYDPASSSFTPIPQMYLGLWPGGTATLLANGKVLLAGGLTIGSPGTSAAAAIYDPSSNTVTPTGNLTVPRSSHTATLLADGRVLVAGGNSGTSSAEVYDPATGTFSAVGSMLQARFRHSATMLPNGKVLIAFGQGGPGLLLVAAELFDPTSNSFAPTGSSTAKRITHTTTTLRDGSVLFVGGTIDDSASAETYDPATGTFSATASPLNARRNHTAVLLPNGKVLIQGGVGPLNPPTGSDIALRSAELYDPVAHTFTRTGGTETLTTGSLALLPDGTLILVGPTCYPVSPCGTPTEIYHP